MSVFQWGMVNMNSEVRWSITIPLMFFKATFINHFNFLPVVVQTCSTDEVGLPCHGLPPRPDRLNQDVGDCSGRIRHALGNTQPLPCKKACNQALREHRSLRWWVFLHRRVLWQRIPYRSFVMVAFSYSNSLIENKRPWKAFAFPNKKFQF